MKNNKKIIAEVSNKTVTGRPTPVFTAIGKCSADENEYIERMINRDKALNWG